MNEINEMTKEVQEIPSLPEVKEVKTEYNVVKDVWSDFVNSIKEYTDAVPESKEIVEAREYGVKECADVAKACFTPEVIRAWGDDGLGRTQ